MLLGLYILCWILIILIIITASIAIIYQKQQLECVGTTNPWCYEDWYCLNPTKTDDQIDYENLMYDPTNYIQISKFTLAGEGLTYPNQPNAGSTMSDCSPLTDKTVLEFNYYKKNSDNSYYKDELGYPVIITENPSEHLNPCQVPIPSCINPPTYKDDGVTVDTSSCDRTTTNYQIGDIYWRACTGGIGSKNAPYVATMNSEGKQTLNLASYTCLLDYN